MPSYLIAIVVGLLESREIGPRSKVWSEKELVDTAAAEFSEVSDHFYLFVLFIKRQHISTPTTYRQVNIDQVF